MTSSAAQRNIEMARKGYTAFNETHIDEAMETIADDIIWTVGGTNPISGTYKGKKEVMNFFATFGQLTEGTYEADVHDILATDDHTVVIGTSTATRHGRTHASRFVDVIHPDAEGKAKEFWRFVEDQAADDQFYSE